MHTRKSQQKIILKDSDIELKDKDLKATIINMTKELLGTTFKQRSVMTMTCQTENTNKRSPKITEYEISN